MSATLRTAQDDILEPLRATMELLGVPVAWPGRPADLPPADEAEPAPWARATIRHATGGQSSLTGGLGVRKWKRAGTLWVQVFTPQGAGNGLGYSIAQEVLDAYEGTATENCVWFRNARINEQPPSGAYLQQNVLVDFEYTELK